MEVSRNQRYWGGEVKLDGAVFYYMQEDEPKLMAMQNDEIDAYTSVTAARPGDLSGGPRQVSADGCPPPGCNFIS